MSKSSLKCILFPATHWERGGGRTLASSAVEICIIGEKFDSAKLLSRCVGLMEGVLVAIINKRMRLPTALTILPFSDCKEIEGCITFTFFFLVRVSPLMTLANLWVFEVATKNLIRSVQFSPSNTNMFQIGNSVFVVMRFCSYLGSL